MDSIILDMINWLKLYWGNSVILLFFILSILYICFTNKEKRKGIVYPLIIALIFIINPVMYKYVWTKTLETTWWRTLWIVPAVIVISYAFVLLISHFNNVIMKFVVLLVFCFLICIGGDSMYSNQTFEEAQNVYKIPQEAIDVADALLELEDCPKAVVTDDLYSYIRQYSTDIKLLYGRDAEGYVRWLSGDLKNAADIVSNGYENIAELAKIMRKNEYKYLVVEEGYNTDIEKYGYEILTNLDGYNIYRDVQLADIYTLTVSNDREPFVSITDSYGEVLMIDGGSMDNLESVKAYVSQKGGSVHKWILTNANSSKAAVAVLAFAGNQGISVKSYIAPDILSDTYKNQIYQSSESTQIDLWLYDNLAYYENLDWFGSLAENGSELNVLTSKIKVLNAYEESSENVRNNSMVFKFGEDYDNSFIYVSDVTQDIIDSIVDEYADRIESKYLIINNENLSVSYQQIAESMNVQKIINLKDVKDKLEIILE